MSKDNNNMDGYKLVSNTMIINGYVFQIDEFNNVYQYELGTMKYIRTLKLDNIIKFFLDCNK